MDRPPIDRQNIRAYITRIDELIAKATKHGQRITLHAKYGMTDGRATLEAEWYVRQGKVSFTFRGKRQRSEAVGQPPAYDYPLEEISSETCASMLIREGVTLSEIRSEPQHPSSNFDRGSS